MRAYTIESGTLSPWVMRGGRKIDRADVMVTTYHNGTAPITGVVVIGETDPHTSTVLVHVRGCESAQPEVGCIEIAQKGAEHWFLTPAGLSIVVVTKSREVTIYRNHDGELRKESEK